jgi:putative nucleotidyltransferase with HDIG domain
VTTIGVESTSIITNIRQAVDRGELTLPPLPEVATRVLDMLNDEDRLELRALQNVIHADVAMTAAVLRMANSAAFGGLQPISELDRAIARLGLQQVATVVVAVSAKGRFQSPDPGRMALLHALWEHSLFTALAAKRLTLMHGGEAEHAFLAGLLHDVGKLLVLKYVDETEKTQGPTQLTPYALDEVMAAVHAELGHETLVRWKIPETICRVVLRHHDSDPAADDHLLIRVQAANTISRKMGAHPHPEPDLVLMEVPAIERLNITDLDLAVLLVDLEDDFARARDLL